MKLFALLLALVVAPPCLALDVEKIRELANTDHNPEGILPELKIFANGREFEATITAGGPGGEKKTSPVVKTYDKVVNKKYIVSQYQPPAAAAPIISVVTYETEAEVFRKWTLMPDGEIHISVGTALPEFGAVSWLRLGHPESQTGFVLGTEHHAADKITWREVTFAKTGGVSYVVDGVAKKTK